MSKNIIVYFHGFEGSINSSKANYLKNFGEVLEFPIATEYKKAFYYIDEQLENLFFNNISDQDSNYYFVGCSLGAWWANLFGHIYDVETILINPSYKPSISLLKYGLDKELCDMYADINVTKLDNIVVAMDDEVIEHENFLERMNILPKCKSLTKYPSGGHRFSGSEFEHYITNFFELKDQNV